MVPSATTPRLRVACMILLPLLLAGCALLPSGTAQENARLAAAGRNFATPFNERAIPGLPATPDWRDVLQRAFLVNGELESDFFQWKGAMDRVEEAASYPNTRVSVGYSAMFSREKVKAFDRQTLTLGFDSMQNLLYPNKVRQGARVALDQAKVAGEQFRAAKFELQQKVLTAWAEFALTAEKIRIQQENVTLLRLARDTASSRVQAGGAQQDLLSSGVMLLRGEDDLKNLEAQLDTQRALLNGLLSRDPRAPLAAPVQLPTPRPLDAGDDRLIAVAADQNPDLARLAQEVQGRRDALKFAQLQWLPDINPSLALTGSASQAIGAAIALPTTVAAIRGAIRESQTQLAASQALLRQTRQDRAAAFVAALIALRNSEREAALLEKEIAPAAQRALTDASQSYAAGATGFPELVEAHRTLLEVRLAAAEARTAREERLAELETLAGIDFETLSSTPQKD